MIQKVKYELVSWILKKKQKNNIWLIKSMIYSGLTSTSVLNIRHLHSINEISG